MPILSSDMLFGTGRSGADLRGTFAPPSGERGSLLATYRGPGAARVLDQLEQRGVITAGQRAAGGGVQSAAQSALEGPPTRGLGSGGAPAGGGTVAAAAAVEGSQTVNPLYGGFMAQSIQSQTGFATPAGPALGFSAEDYAFTPVDHGAAPAAPATPDARLAPAPGADVPAGPTATTGGATADAAAPVVDDAMTRVAQLEQRLITGLQRLGELPADAQVQTLARAVDATAPHGGDAYDVLARALLDRPLDDAVVAFERALDEVARLPAPNTPLAHVAGDAAKLAAPVVDDAARAAAPGVHHAAAPAITAASTRSLLVGGGDDALRGVMPFAAGVDDLVRTLARF